GIEIDLAWRAGQATVVKLRPSVDGEFVVRPPRGQRVDSVGQGTGRLPLPARPDGVVTEKLAAGREYVVRFRPETPASISWDAAQQQPPAWYASAEAGRIADNVLHYQRTTGGWPKDIDMARPLSIDDRAALDRERTLTDSTIDNGATVTQARYLARVFASTH